MSGRCLDLEPDSKLLKCFHGIKICSYRLSSCLGKQQDDHCECTFDPSVIETPVSHSPTKLLEYHTLGSPKADSIPQTSHIRPNCGPLGYCKWSGGRKPGLFCYFRKRKCSEHLTICQKARDQCTCGFQPYTELELVNEMGTEKNPGYGSFYKSLAIPQEQLSKLIYPNGYCTFTSGKGSVPRCHHRRRLCSLSKTDCRYERQPCTCDQNPFKKESTTTQLPLISSKEAPTNGHGNGLSRRGVDLPGPFQEVYPNGYCRTRAGPARGLRCHYRLRVCSLRTDICFHFDSPCLCEFDPYASIKRVEVGKAVPERALVHARPDIPSKDNDNKRRKTIGATPQTQQGPPQPSWTIGYCGWSYTHARRLVCFRDRRQCTFKEGSCKYAQQPCTCDYDPYGEGPSSFLRTVSSNNKGRRQQQQQQHQHQQPFPTSATKDPSKTTSMASRPTKLVAGKAVSEWVFPHGYCRHKPNRGTQLFCYLGLRQCSFAMQTCTRKLDPCVCHYNPYTATDP